MHDTSSTHRPSAHASQHSARARTKAPRTAARSPWWLLVVLCTAQFMVVLDATIVNVALPSIGRELGFASRDLQWVVTAYVLMTGGLLLLGGRLADLVGRRLVFFAGLVVFTGASLASGVAGSPAALIAARAGQGLGAAMLSPAALGIITASYSGQQRTKALSAWGAIGGAGAAAGMLLGGMLTTWLGWEWVFFVNVPVGLIAAVSALRVVPVERAARRSLRDLDVPGALLLVAGLAVLTYSIEGASSHGWGSARTLVLLGAGAVLLLACAAAERAAVKPLLPAATLRLRSLASSTGVMLAATTVLIGTFFLNSLFLQNVLGDSPLKAGLATLPGVLVVGAAAHVGPRLLVRFGARPVMAIALAVIGCGDLLLSGAGAHAQYATELLPGILVLGVGMGLAFVAISVTAMAEVGAEDSGVASGLVTTGHELGGAFGVSIFSAIALASGPAAGASFTAGYQQGTLAAAVIAGALALAALAAVPGVKPTSTAGASMH